MKKTQRTAAGTIRRIQEIGVVPVVRAASLDEARRAVEAVCAGGISIVEITMTVPNAPSMIREIAERQGDQVLVGAGTVLNAAQAKTCLDAGAEFLVSPGISTAVLHAAAERGKLAIPGALTPSEIMQGLEEGIKLFKIFPCGSVGGPKYLKSLRGPFPDCSFIPTGGVSISNAAEYIAAGAVALGVGTELVDPEALRRNDLQKISAAAKALLDAVRDSRAQLEK